MTRTFDKEMAAEIRAEHEKGEKLNSLAKKYYCSVGTLMAIIHKKGAYKKD
jgi:Mor family transcriptional regulator